MDINALITKKETLVANQFDDVVHIALCFDKNYGLPAGVLLTSILKNNPGKNIAIHLFVLSINDDDIAKFKLFTNNNVSITLYYVNNDFDINPKTLVLSYTTIATCLRLFIPEYLKNTTDRLLYLDCDMLCHGDLSLITDNDISDVIIAATLDLEGSQKIRTKSCNLKLGTYFNAGMLYINTTLWSEHGITEKALAKINDGNVYEYADQDILNILLPGKVKFLPIECNRMQFKRDKHGQIKNDLLAKTIIFHYIGASKPWYIVEMDNLYREYFTSSFWKDNKLAMANGKTPSSIRKYGRYYLRKGHYLTAFKYKLIYFLCKVRLIKSFEKYL